MPTAGRWVAMAFGIPFLAMGVLTGLVAAGVLPAKKNAPDWVIAGAALMFFTTGVGLVIHGARGIVRRMRADRLAAANPDVPCLADHPWDMKGALDDGAGRIAIGAFGLLVVALFLAPFNWWAFSSGAGPFPLEVVVAFFDGLVVLGLGNLCHLVLRRLKYGVTRLDFRRFPFVLGDRLEVVLHSDRLGAQGRATVILRCLEERIDERQPGRDDRREHHAYEVWSARQEIDLGTISHREWGLLPISFALPDADLGTRLRDNPWRCWELDIQAETPGLDFGATFLVPVYPDQRARRESNPQPSASKADALSN
jgi:hypothetical protein